MKTDQKKLSIISFTFDDDVFSDINAKLLFDTKVSNTVRNLKMQNSLVDQNIIKENMTKTICNVLEVFDGEQFNKGQFDVDEIEIALNIGVEGTVSILSAVSGSINTQSGIVVKFKRRKASHARKQAKIS